VLPQEWQLRAQVNRVTSCPSFSGKRKLSRSLSKAATSRQFRFPPPDSPGWQATGPSAVPFVILVLPVANFVLPCPLYSIAQTEKGGPKKVPAIQIHEGGKKEATATKTG
jgi:hypothetical protein